MASMPRFGLLVLLLFTSCHGSFLDSVCKSSNDCSPDECCVIGWNRYDIPACRTLPDVGDFCSYRDKDLMTRELAFPNVAPIMVENLYIGFCPCRSRLTCLERTCREN